MYVIMAGAVRPRQWCALYVIIDRSHGTNTVCAQCTLSSAGTMHATNTVCTQCTSSLVKGGGPRIVVSTAAFYARVRGSVPALGGLKETKMFPPHPRVKLGIVGSLRDREVACSASDRQGSKFESCVWRTVSSPSSHHPQEVLLAQFTLCVHKGGLKPDSFHFLSLVKTMRSIQCVRNVRYHRQEPCDQYSLCAMYVIIGKNHATNTVYAQCMSSSIGSMRPIQCVCNVCHHWQEPCDQYSVCAMYVIFDRQHATDTVCAQCT